MIGGLCFKGCCKKVGYDRATPWPHFSYTYEDIGVQALTAPFGFQVEMLEDPAMKLLFIGLASDICGASQKIAEEDWQPLKDWISGGGRVWYQAEYGGSNDSITKDTIPGCETGPVPVNEFLSFMGSLHWNGGAYSSGCSHACTPGDAKIANDSEEFRVAATAEIVGGTSLWIEPEASKVVAAGEKIGDGFFFCCGDSNTTGGCGVTNVDFFRKLLDKDSSDIL